MSVIYLKHEMHGNKVAIDEVEAAADEKRGWKRVKTPVTPMDPVQMAKDEAASMVVWERQQKEEREQRSQQGRRSR